MPGERRPGAATMRALAADLPNGLLTGFQRGREVELPNGRPPTTVYAVGMGGSAIAADLIRDLADSETRVPLAVVRGAELPRALGESSRAILVSYSGETWETLRAYVAAERAGASRVVVTSGGTLAERAEADDVPVVRLPPGMPARGAVGYLIGGLLGLLDPTFPESNEGRVAAVAERLRPEIGRYARADGPAARVAAAIGDRIPSIFAPRGFGALARRWKTQIEENAKRIAQFDEFPEAFHNAVVAWNALSRLRARGRAAVLLDRTGGEASVHRLVGEFERIVRARGATVVRVALDAEDRLEAILRGVALGDQVSLRLAERGKVDPLPVEAIARLRESLGPAAFLPPRPPA